MEHASISTIISDSRKLLLKSPITVAVFFDGTAWCVVHEATGVFSFGMSKAEAFASFHDDFLATWKSVTNNDSARPTPDVLKARRTLLSIVSQEEAA